MTIEDKIFHPPTDQHWPVANLSEAALGFAYNIVTGIRGLKRDCLHEAQNSNPVFGRIVRREQSGPHFGGQPVPFRADPSRSTTEGIMLQGQPRSEAHVAPK